MSTAWTIRAPQPHDTQGWAALRAALWPDESADALAAEIPAMLAAPQRFATFLAVAADHDVIGFAEASLRRDYVNGTESSPVGFLEGWYVASAWRNQGIGRALVRAVEQWTCALGCTELASDALLDNPDSHRAHAACGFEETERVVCFRKVLAPR